MPGKAKSLARASLSAAAGVAVLYLGAIVPGIRLSVLCVATLGVAFVKMSCPGWWPLGCYGVTAALALLLLPDKTLAVLYAVFMGYYPLVKLRAERCAGRLLRWGVKLGAFHAAALALFLLIRAFSLMTIPDGTAILVLWAAGLLFFLAYDYALGLLFLYYLRKIAGRIR